MAAIYDVAKYILEKIKETSVWKLQKLCYYSQAWHLAWTGKALFAEDFQAWRSGPICPELYLCLKGRFIITDSNLEKGDSGVLSSDEKDSIEKVIEEYGGLQPYELREQSRAESPWRAARAGLPDDISCKMIIGKDSMELYYRNQT